MTIKVYDNEGKTIDRYTVVIEDQVYTMSARPFSWSGVNQYMGTLDEVDPRSLGIPILIYDVGSEVMEAIQDRMYAQL